MMNGSQDIIAIIFKMSFVIFFTANQKPEKRREQYIESEACSDGDTLHVQGAALVVTWSCLTPWWPGAGTPRARCAWPPSHQLRPPGHRAHASPGHLHTANISHGDNDDPRQIKTLPLNWNNEIQAF